MDGNAQEAKFFGLIGATGTGKSFQFRRLLKKIPAKMRKRTLIWSPKEAKDNYAGLFPGSIVVRSPKELAAVAIAEGRKKEFHIVFVPTLDNKTDFAWFNFFCMVAMRLENLVMFVEEIHTCTKASHAAEWWTKVNLMGRASWLWVFAASQRPAKVDKDFMSSLSFIHCGRLAYPPDQKAMAETLGIDRAEIAALVGYQAIQKDLNTGEIVRIK